MIDPVRAEARARFQSELRADDRVLVTGAGGWFGSTIAALLHGFAGQVMLTTQRPRDIAYGVGSAPAVAWDDDDVAAFAPTVAVDCAFILRDYIPDMSLEHYVHENTLLTGRLLRLTRMPSVRLVLSVSSGAAVHPRDATEDPVEANPYGYLKRQAELALLEAGRETGTPVSIARAWSLSGALVSRPERYALSNLILQARTGVIRIESDRPIRRRYAALDDYFAVALANASVPGTVVESGGELLEFTALAERIVQELDVTATIERPSLTAPGEDDYANDGRSWIDAIERVGYKPATLGDQIRALDAYLHER